MESKVITIAPNAPEQTTRRVAAYCRVSSSSDDQLHSFAAQVQYYTALIGENEQMELADIYADEGVTGTKTAKRDDFNRLIADCKKGKIDRVITKSVSRFARNTADALLYARLLKEYGVTVLFEKENIDTAYMSSELLLAISGAQAQEESVSISKQQRWSIERRMKNGTYLASSTPYGYELKDGKFQIVEEEAETVRLIFQSFLSGMGKKAIAEMLNERNIPIRYGHRTWRINTVSYILTNERYIGDALFQKSYTTETLPFVSKPNRGEKAQYYVENTNPPIIAREDFERAQSLLKDNAVTDRNAVAHRPLSRKIRCRCGSSYSPITINHKRYWSCKAHDADAKRCEAKRIPESDIYEAFLTMVNKLRNCRADILPAAIAQTERLQMKAGGTSGRIREIDREIAELNGKNLVLARLNTKGILRPAEYAEQSGALNSRVNTLRTERRQLLREQDEDSVLSGLRRLNDLLAELENPVTEFDGDLFDHMVEEITVPADRTLVFRLIGGLQLTETTPDRRRNKRI